MLSWKRWTSHLIHHLQAFLLFMKLMEPCPSHLFHQLISLNYLHINRSSNSNILPQDDIIPQSTITPYIHDNFIENLILEEKTYHIEAKSEFEDQIEDVIALCKRIANANFAVFQKRSIWLKLFHTPILHKPRHYSRDSIIMLGEETNNLAWVIFMKHLFKYLGVFF